MKPKMKPKWTVLYNIVSKENGWFIGTGWEFFEDEKDAEMCYERQLAAGNCPTKRPFYLRVDGHHLGATHREIRELARKKPRTAELYPDVRLGLLRHANAQPRAITFDAERVWREEISKWREAT